MASFGNVQSLYKIITGIIILTGSNNVGTVTSNINVKVNAAACTPTVRSNINCKFDIEYTRLEAHNNINTKVKGQKGNMNLGNNINLKTEGESNEGVFQNNMNLKFKGDQNECKFQHNTNLEYLGDNGQCVFLANTNARLLGNKNEISASNNANLEVKGDSNGKCFFSKNTNAKLLGDKNKVSASQNTNLEVLGDNHHLTISGTTNHVLKTLTESSSENVLRIVPNGPNVVVKQNGINEKGFFGGLFQYFFGGNTVINSGSFSTVNIFGNGKRIETTETVGVTTIDVTYYIDYIKEATINSSEYNLGIFKFNMVKKDKQAQLTFEDSRFDSGSFGVTNLSGGEYSITGTKDGNTQTISVIGPSIALSGTNGLNITW